MPNWACNHIVASGDEKDLRALAETLNTMPNLENGFGRYWMGNLVAALLKLSKDELMAVKGMHFRGTIDPDFYAQACLCGPYVDEKKEFTVDEDGMMRFSTTSAWDRSEDVEDLIMEHFPSVELAWSCTDEFGNPMSKNESILPNDSVPFCRKILCHLAEYQINLLSLRCVNT